MKKKLVAIMIMCLLATSLTACKGEKSGDSVKPEEKVEEKDLDSSDDNKDKIVISEMRGESWMPVYLAEELGYFEEEGLETEFIVFKDGPIAFQGMHAGDSDFCMLSTEPVLRAHEEGLKSRIIIPTVKSKQYMFATSQDVKEIKDLKGKAIFGGMPGSAPYSFVLALLEQNGLDKNDVEWINMEYGAALGALEKGTISGAYFDSQNSIEVKKINGNILVDTSDEKVHKDLYGTEYYESQMVVVTEDYLKENPETVQKFVNAVVKAIDWQNNHSDKEIADVVKPMFDGKDLEEVIGAIRGSLNKDGRYSKEGYSAVENFCLSQDIIKEAIGYENIIDMSFVEKAWENLNK